VQDFVKDIMSKKKTKNAEDKDWVIKNRLL